MRSVPGYTKASRRDGTTNWGQIVLFFVSSAAGAQNLDLRALAKYSYRGQDDAQQKSPCQLVATTAVSDFGGKLYQDFVIRTDGPAPLNYRSRYTGRAWTLPADLKLDNARVQFVLSLPPNYTVQIIANRDQPEQIQEFVLSETDPVTGRPAPRILCRKVVTRAK